VDHPGEVFGWSSLSGRGVYSASAECRKPTKLLRIEADRLFKILENDPASGLIFFRRLSGILGNRLLQMYRTVSVMSKRAISLSYGTGQVAESDATAA
jgi:CRP-like cAMP-binding protein